MDHEFIASWMARIQLADTGMDALADAEARNIIRKREDAVRPGKQRLRVPHQLSAWKLPDGYSSGRYQMDYRHRVGRQIAMDIVAGLEAGAA